MLANLLPWKFYRSSEAHITIDEKLTPIQKEVGLKINNLLYGKNYGISIENWRYLSIINPRSFYDDGFFRETNRYSKKEHSVEFRLRINYLDFLKADTKKAYELICKSILRSVDIAETKFKIKDFDFSSFRNDLKHLFKEEGWM